MNLTIRNIPETIINKIRVMASLEKRSVNNEILVLLEHAVEQNNTKDYSYVSAELKADLLKSIAGAWDDNNDTSGDALINQIQQARTPGRAVEL